MPHQTKERTPKKREKKHSFKQESENNNDSLLTPKSNGTYYRTTVSDQITHTNEKSINSSLNS